MEERRGRKDKQDSTKHYTEK